MESVVPGVEGVAAVAAEAGEEGAEGRWAGCSAGGTPGASVPLWRGRWPWPHSWVVPAMTSAASPRNLQGARGEPGGGQVGPLLVVAVAAVAVAETAGGSLAGGKPHCKRGDGNRAGPPAAAAAAAAAVTAGEAKEEEEAAEQRPEQAQVLDQGEGGMLHKGGEGKGSRCRAHVAAAAGRAQPEGGVPVQEQALRKNQHLPRIRCLPHGRGFLVLLHALLPLPVLHLVRLALLPGPDS